MVRRGKREDVGRDEAGEKDANDGVFFHQWVKRGVGKPLLLRTVVIGFSHNNPVILNEQSLSIHHSAANRF